MEKIQIQHGRLYAMRQPRHDSEAPLIQVKAILNAPRGNQVKIEYLDGELRGLQEFVPSRDILCLWGKRTAFLRDERRMKAVMEASLQSRDRIEEDAISLIFEATGEEGGFIKVWSTDPACARRLWARAGLDGDPTDHRLAFIDRHGLLHLPYEEALRFAQAFAAAEPEPCIHTITEYEDRLRAKGYRPGERFSHKHLRESKPAYALVRQWAGAAEVELLRKEVARLHQVVNTAIGMLQKLDAQRQVGIIERAMRGE